MKKIYLIIIGCLLSSTTFASEINSFTEEFQQVEKECTQLANDFINSNNNRDQFDKQACLNWSLEVTLAENPASANNVILAAMKASEDRTSVIISVAIAAGIEPAKVVASATRAYPMKAVAISKAAIMAGADPVVVTEATAAGKPKK